MQRMNRTIFSFVILSSVQYDIIFYIFLKTYCTAMYIMV